MPKKMANSCHFIAFLSINASGIDKVTVAVIKAKAVPRGIPLPTNASIIGIIETELAYKGTPMRVARGTDHQALIDKYFSINEAGT